MGGILADIHKIDFSSPNLTDDDYIEEHLIDWDYYIDKGRAANAPWLDLLQQNIDNLYNWNGRLVDAAKRLDSKIVISHGDLDPKNVMWVGDDPIVIDWEAAGYIHPMHDLVETALYWSANGNNAPSKEKFIAFVAGYRCKADRVQADWKTVLDKGFGAKLGWLEYSLKRSPGIESADEEEQRMGSEHVFRTTRDLQKYDAYQDEFIAWLDDANKYDVKAN